MSHVLPSLKTRGAVRDFAKRVGIHPGIVVGRLQHDKLIDHTWMNNMKVSFRFKEEAYTK
jgi:HTH-type transcriptional regulator/antitoxin HigA